MINICRLGPSINSRGYSTIKVGGTTHQRHRVEWEKHNGPVPYGLYVCHRCDNKQCYEITHLFLGTQKDNVDDYNRKGLRDVSGERNGSAKLTEDEVYEIRRLYNKGLTQVNLAKKFKIAQSSVGRIVRGESWNRL